MSSSYCPYLGQEHSGPMDQEHIIPEALGGTPLFSIMTSKKANNDLGGQVDGPFANSTLVAMCAHIVAAKTGDSSHMLRFDDAEIEADGNKRRVKVWHQD